ncbi:MAG: glutamine amidotransferase [Peptococcaceae bacterium BICA1-8]|nr:MAG: glutamine amidotransferase [Peptococcaceae bacterium BICA1-8]
MKIGVLALQGAFREHIEALKKCKVEAIEIKKSSQLDDIDGLIIPGGESTTIGLLMQQFNLGDKILEKANHGMPILGTCAGMVMLAKDIVDSEQFRLGLMDIIVRRNAFGRQRESFERSLNISALGDEPFKAIFIRAPYIEATSPNVEVLCKLDNEKIIFVKQGNCLAASFHPELTEDIRVHQYFVRLVNKTI